MYIASLVLGIVSIVFCGFPFLGFVLGGTALGIGVTSFIKYKKSGKTEGKGIVLAGFITSIVGASFATIITILFVFGLMFEIGMDLNNSTCPYSNIPFHSCDNYDTNYYRYNRNK